MLWDSKTGGRMCAGWLRLSECAHEGGEVFKLGSHHVRFDG